MTVRAKFWVNNIRHAHCASPDQVYVEVELCPVYGDENKPWSKATPQGQIKMSITNPDAVVQFELGKHFWVDFIPAD